MSNLSSFAADSDRDGYSDAQELALGSNPMYPGSTPLALLPGLGMLGRAVLMAVLGLGVFAAARVRVRT